MRLAVGTVACAVLRRATETHVHLLGLVRRMDSRISAHTSTWASRGQHIQAQKQTLRNVHPQQCTTHARRMARHKHT